MTFSCILLQISHGISFHNEVSYCICMTFYCIFFKKGHTISLLSDGFHCFLMTFSAYNHQKSHIPAKTDLRHIQKTLHARNISAYHSRIQKTPTKKDPRHIQKTPPKPRFESLSKSPRQKPRQKPVQAPAPRLHSLSSYFETISRISCAYSGYWRAISSTSFLALPATMSLLYSMRFLKD